MSDQAKAKSVSSRGETWVQRVVQGPAVWYWQSSGGKRVYDAEVVFAPLLRLNKHGQDLYWTRNPTMWGDALDALAENPRRSLDGSGGRPQTLRGRDQRYADLSGADLRDIDTAGSSDWYNFLGANLQGANLSGLFHDREHKHSCGATCPEANLEGALLEMTCLRDLRGSRLSGASLWAANLRAVDARAADLREANCFGADFEGADLGGANLQGANLSFCMLKCVNFEGADLSGANLSGAYILGVKNIHQMLSSATNLSRVNLARAYIWSIGCDLDLSGRNLRGACFEEAYVSTVIFNGADLTAARFMGADIAESVFARAILKGADLRRAHLSTSTNQRAASFEEADLSGADLRSADFGFGRNRSTKDGPKFFRADLSGANLAESSAVDSDFRDANFERADLSGTRFVGSDLRGARFRGAKLAGTDFRGADFRDADFEGADLSGARMP